MKIDRVILAVNNNPIYCQHWNIVAPIWKNIFNINPTLIFYGNQNDFESNKFNLDGYDYKILPYLPSFSEPNPDWVVTWSLFWAASTFTNEVCMLCGIDQIPIGRYFFNLVNEVQNNKFIIGFSDAYKNYNKDTLGYFNTVTNVLYPSSHLVGTGKKFKEIFEIDDNWQNEISKVFHSKSRYYLNNNFYNSKLWGLDECYASEKISTFKNKEEFVHLNIFWDYWYKRRIDFDGASNYNFNIDLIKNGYYSEITCKKIHNQKFQQAINAIQK